MELVEEMGHTDNSYQMQLSHNWQSVSRFEISCHPSMRALVCPHLKYLTLVCWPKLVAGIDHLERIRRLATRLVTGMRHVPYEETAETTTLG